MAWPSTCGIKDYIIGKRGVDDKLLLATRHSYAFVNHGTLPVCAWMQTKVTNEMSFAWINRKCKRVVGSAFHLDAWLIVNLGMKFGDHNINLVERLWIPKGRLKDHELGSRGDLWRKCGWGKNSNTIYFIFVHAHFTLDMYLSIRNHLRSLVFLYLFESLFELDYAYKPPYAQNIQRVSTKIV